MQGDYLAANSTFHYSAMPNIPLMLDSTKIAFMHFFNLVADKQQIHSFGWFVTTKIVLSLGLAVAPGLHATDFIIFLRSVLFSNSNLDHLARTKCLSLWN